MSARPPELARCIAVLVGRRIRELRWDAEMTQAELARRVGTHRPIIGRIERGLHMLDVATCERIAEALELDLATLLVCLDESWQQAGQHVRQKLQEVAT